MRSFLGLAILVLSACFENIHAPRCRTLADCPVDQGYTSCEDGYCFRGPGCNRSAPIPGDGCCPTIEGDRTPDSDCILLDIFLEGAIQVTTPASDSSGTMFVAGLVINEVGGKLVTLWKISEATVSSVTVGKGAHAIPALLSERNFVYVGFEEGVLVYDAVDLSERAVIPSQAPVGGLASTRGKPLHVVAWPTVGQEVVVYDESQSFQTQYFDLKKATRDPELAGDEIFAPIVSESGRRLILATKGGRIGGVEVGGNPMGPKAYKATGLGFVGPPVERAGRIYVACSDNTVRCFTEVGSSYEETWITPLPGRPVGPMLVDSEGGILVALREGKVIRLWDRLSDAETVVLGEFDVELAPLSPLLTVRPRIVAIAGNMARVASVYAAEGGKWNTGFWFDLPATAVGSPTLVFGRLIVPVAGGRLFGVVLSEDLPGRGFPCAGGDLGNSRKMMK